MKNPHDIIHASGSHRGQLRRNRQQGLHVRSRHQGQQDRDQAGDRRRSSTSRSRRVNTVRTDRQGQASWACTPGRRAEVKKAYVKLTESSKPIAFFEGMAAVIFAFLGGNLGWLFKFYKPTSPGRRFMSVSAFEEITMHDAREVSARRSALTTGGRNVHGKITVRHPRRRRRASKYRIIDFKRNKDGIPATVATIEYDPNRSANIALLLLRGRREALHHRSPRPEGRRHRS